jgi:hypothetical protein
LIWKAKWQDGSERLQRTTSAKKRDKQRREKAHKIGSNQAERSRRPRTRMRTDR